MKIRNAAAVMTVAWSLTAVAQTGAWVRVVDDFGAGIGAWTNSDSGRLEWVKDGTNGHLLWRSADDGIGRIRFLDMARLDVAGFDRLRFRYRITGKNLNNLNPVLQQFPFNQGFKALYWSVDTLDVRLGEWTTYVQELDQVENSWPDTYSRTNAGFEFEVHQLPGAERTVVELDDIALERNVLGLDRAYPGEWSALPDGSQETEFRIAVRNLAARPIALRVTPLTNAAARARVHLPQPALDLAPGATGAVAATVSFDAGSVRSCPPYYGEMPALLFAVAGDESLALTTLLPAGIRPPKAAHPSILCDAGRAADLRRLYLNEEQRKTLNPILLQLAKEAEKSLAFEPAYPPLANMAGGYNQCLVDGTNLVAASMPNLPEPSYQCPHCGRFYRGLFYQAAMENWYGRHRANADAAYKAGIGYLLTGRPEFARKAVQVLRGYIDTYLDLPVAANAGVHAPIACSGATRIGGSYMQEQNWLTQLAVALDCIRDSGELDEAALRDLAEKVFEPSATRMMNHRVGLMNLQWMIDRAGVFAGLATENPALVARALYGDHGIVRLMEEGYLADGFWRENPSYINVLANEGYPVLGTLFGNGILPYTPAMDLRYKAMWHLAAPDGRFPTLGTGGPPGMELLINGVKAVAHLSNDPEMAWIDRTTPQVKNVGMYFSCVMAAFQAKGTRLPPGAERPLVPATTNLADYGVAVLRVPGSDAYAALAWGRHLVHGHFNKLSVNAYAKGGWFARNVWGGYGKGFYEYLEATAGSGTVMVDGRSQDADTGELLALESLPGAVAASARENGAWKDVEHERTVVLTAHWMLVLDNLASDKPHVYDWLWHGQGVSRTDRLSWQEGPGIVDGAPLRLNADSNSCYAFFEPVEARAVAAPVTRIRYSRPDGSGVALSLLDPGSAALYRTGSTNWPHEGLVFRQRAADAAFACLFEPLSSNALPRLTLEPATLKHAERGVRVDLRQARAVWVVDGDKRTLVAVNYTGLPLQTESGRIVKAVPRIQVVAP